MTEKGIAEAVGKAKAQSPKKEEPHLDGFVEGAAPLCVFCNAPWTDDMIKIYIEGQFDFGYYPGEFSVDGYDTTIDITCSSCERLVYRKEVILYDEER
jgi:hypothetical protein